MDRVKWGPEMTNEVTSTGFGPLPWEAWTAIGTGILAIATWALAGAAPVVGGSNRRIGK